MAERSGAAPGKAKARTQAAGKGKRRASAPPAPSLSLRIWRQVRRWGTRFALLLLGLILFFGMIDPPTTPYQISESLRLGGVKQDWRDLDDISENLWLAVVAGEDAKFCEHWGFDLASIRLALSEGRGRGASTISQQTVKNVYLWQGRSWLRKALEAVLTPGVEALWSKARILEVYLNVAEFGRGVFGAEAAAQHYFGVSAKDLSLSQAARLAAILPNPQGLNPVKATAATQRRAAQIIDGALTIRAGELGDCLPLTKS